MGVILFTFTSGAAPRADEQVGREVKPGGATTADGPQSPGEPAKAAAGKEAGGAEKKYPPLDPALGGVEGLIVLKGKAPEPPEVKVPPNHQDQSFCVQHVKSEALVLGKKNEVANAVISVAGFKPKEKPKPQAIQLDNKNCLFTPHVQATTVGSTIKLSNSDGFIHNSQGLLALSVIGNSAIPPKGALEKKVTKAGWGVVTCSFHTWMQAHVHVFAHELFDVSAPTGRYKLVNIPPGTYEIEIWHEILAPQKQKVTIEAGKIATLDVELEAYKDAGGAEGVSKSLSR